MREDQQLLCEDCDQPVETQVRNAIGDVSNCWSFDEFDCYLTL